MGMTLLLCYMLRNDAFDAVYFVPAESGLWNEEKKTMNQQSITSLKGIGEKTAKLFAKLGVETVEELLHDYPRAYDAYEEPVPIGKLREKEMFAVSGQLMKTPSVRRFKNIQVIITDVRDMTGALQLTWYNMPYLRNVLQMGQILIFRGRVVKKSGRLTMEQPGCIHTGTVPEDHAFHAAGVRPDKGPGQQGYYSGGAAGVRAAADGAGILTGRTAQPLRTGRI